MKCPKCLSDLKVTHQDNLQTLSEHVTNPNAMPSLKDAYQCVNTECPCHMKFVWNSDGELYCNGFYDEVNKIFDFDTLSSAIGTISRKLDIEVYKKGLVDKIYLHPILMLYFFKPYIEFHYKADMNGNVLNRWWSIGILKRNGSTSYNIHARFCWQTWSYLWRSFQRSYQSGNYVRAFEPSFNRAWVYRWFESFVRFIYWNKYKIVKNDIR